MDPSLPASEIIIAKVNDGSNIGQPGASSGDMAAFLDLLALVKGQDGVLRQYWGLNMDEPQQLLWQVDWASYERTLRWVKGPIHPTLVEKASAVFDFPAQAPVILYTHWNGDVTPTADAPLTELAFFSLPPNITNAQKQDIIQRTGKHDRSATSNGKAVAAVTGHTIQTVHTVPQPTEFLRSQYGWQSADEAREWRSSSSYKSEASAISADFKKNGFEELIPAPFPGVDSKTGLFHVSFTVLS